MKLTCGWLRAPWVYPDSQLHNLYMWIHVYVHIHVLFCFHSPFAGASRPARRFMETAPNNGTSLAIL